MRNKRDKDIIRPDPLDRYKYLNDGAGICNSCGAVMEETLKNQIGVYICPACGWECDVMEYEYEDGDEMELVQDERGDSYSIPKMDMPPAGCRVCGGPYPHCKSTCKEYDD